MFIISEGNSLHSRVTPLSDGLACKGVWQYAQGTIAADTQSQSGCKPRWNGQFASCTDAFSGGYVGDPGLRCAYPGLNPVGIRLRVHVLNGRSLRRDYRNIGSAMSRRQYTTQNIQRGASVNDIRNSAARRRPDRTRAERQRGCSRG